MKHRTQEATQTHGCVTILRSCWSRLSRTKQTEMTMLRFTRLHLKTGQKRHSDAAGENQNTTNSKDSTCRNGSCVNFSCARFSSLSGLKPSPSWPDSLSDSLRFLEVLGGHRRHHGRIPCVVEPRRGTVATMAGPSTSWRPGGLRRPHGRIPFPSPSWPAARSARTPRRA